MGKVVCIVGCSYGDEGKGKIVDAIAKEFDIVCRYHGGDNAGHTVCFGDKVYKLSLIPTGIFNPHIKIVLAHGMVINPETLLKEIKYIEKSGFVLKDRLFISENAHLVFKYHQSYDQLIEKLDQNKAIGTTKKGIGYCYSDKMKRINLRIKDIFANKLILQEKFNKIAKLYNPIFKEYQLELIDVDGEIKKLISLRKKIKSYVTDTITYLKTALSAGKKILLEGSQGMMLDIDYGNYPFVTSSSVANFFTTTGFSYKDINGVIGVVKAYTTRVGNGILPTEIKDKKINHYIRERGQEYGTITKRARRIGWIDLVSLKYCIEILGITEIAITLIDVLSHLKKLKICIGYKSPNKRLDLFNQKNQPIYLQVPGWQEDISSKNTWAELPKNAQFYLRYICDYLGVRLKYISNGKEREKLITINHDSKV